MSLTSTSGLFAHTDQEWEAIQNDFESVTLF